MLQKIKNYYHLLQAFLSAAFYSFPSKEIKVIGVTGTDGKTTTVHMIHEILAKNGIKASYISSIHAQIGSKVYKTGFHVTTPSAWQIQKLMRLAVNSNHRYFILEATSHGLDQHRLSFINFEVGVLTNITHEHLDYHKTWENYAQTKLKLLKSSKFKVLNRDDQSFQYLEKYLKDNVLTYSLKKEGNINSEIYPLKLSVPGQYNFYNALAACSAAQILGISKFKIIRAINKFQTVEGRMQQVNLGQKFKVYIDFAHTPNALKEALLALKKDLSPNSKIIAVFGSAGKRDKSKRPLMGQAADENADVIILTAEDPRGEPISSICSDIIKGIKTKKLDKSLFVVQDRKEAIDYAVGLANENDIVVMFGKGHEKSMCYDKVEMPWSELDIAKRAVRSKLNNK